MGSDPTLADGTPADETLDGEGSSEGRNERIGAGAVNEGLALLSTDAVADAPCGDA